MSNFAETFWPAGRFWPAMVTAEPEMSVDMLRENVPPPELPGPVVAVVVVEGLGAKRGTST